MDTVDEVDTTTGVEEASTTRGRGTTEEEEVGMEEEVRVWAREDLEEGITTEDSAVVTTEEGEVMAGRMGAMVDKTVVMEDKEVLEVMTGILEKVEEGEWVVVIEWEDKEEGVVMPQPWEVVVGPTKGGDRNH